MIKNMDIICTVGPSSLNKDILEKLKDRGTDFFRINLSHTPESEIEEKVRFIQGLGFSVMIDTEGKQIRTGNKNTIEIIEGEKIKIWNKKIKCNNKNIFLTPFDCIGKIGEGNLINLDFNSGLIKINSTKNLKKGFIEGVVLIGGVVGSRKGVHLDPQISFPAFSKKDLYAIKIAKKLGIRNFSLSFIDSAREVKQFKKIYPQANFLTKIETGDALENLDEILSVSKGILIDRGDLSRYVPVERIPSIQEKIIGKARSKNKKVFFATNTLEGMEKSLMPSKSEVNDIIKTLKDGATGVVLTRETAIGKHPVETINMLSSIIKEFLFFRKYSLFNKEYLYSLLLPPPHGGKLVDRTLKKIPKEELKKMYKIKVSEETIMDAEQIAVGSFSPLRGFMNKKDLESVLKRNRLSNGIVWPLPIILQLAEIKNLKKGQKVVLNNEKDGKDYAIMEIEDIYKLNKNKIAKEWFGTLDGSHPGVKKFISGGNFAIGGNILLLKRRDSESQLYELTPRQTRRVFSEKGWAKVVGFHTRNVIHRSHEFIQMEAMKKGLCDGLFVHPVIGKKKKGDFQAKTIINSYEKMIQEIYPKGKVVFSTLATYSRYSGPREALFTALVRKNFGCSHFIVGRDHTGVGNFYEKDASQKIFKKFGKKEIGIIPLPFKEVFYSKKQKKYIETESKNIDKKNFSFISGSQMREMIRNKKKPPSWFMRPEVYGVITNNLKNGEKVFVE